MIVPVILCGGSGTRLWPLSRSSYPKQFVDLGKGRTLFKETIGRSKEATKSEEDGGNTPYVVTSESHRFYAQANLFECNQKANIIVEPIPRNTAPAIASVAYCAYANDHDVILLVMPSDHVFEKAQEFNAAVERGRKLAEKGYLVTFGIRPTSPETGFGYIKQGATLDEVGYIVEKFIEKPKKDLAEQFLSSGNFYWNSGIFMFKASRYLEELEKYAPSINDKVQRSVVNSRRIDNVIYLERESFAESDSISIDYAVMERTKDAAVVALDSEWTDLGSWEAFYESKPKDTSNNVIEGDVISIDTKNCYINSRNRLVATIGLRDLAVIETIDAVLVVPLNRSQDVRSIVCQLKDKKRPEAEVNPLVYRPWGSYEELSKGDRFQVKRIVVRPGEELSLQKHYHRAEHWIVVQGCADVVLGEDKLFLSENQSTYIPAGEIHRLKNPGKIPLILIEVQSGPYLGEDDIVRISDKYHRI